MVWGCISGGRSCIFQQDDVKTHSAHITKAWLRKERVQDWPACSPDLIVDKKCCNFYMVEQKCMKMTLITSELFDFDDNLSNWEMQLSLQIIYAVSFAVWYELHLIIIFNYVLI